MDKVSALDSNYVLMVSTLVFAFKIIMPITFSAVEEVRFQWRKFSMIREFLHKKRFMEIFHKFFFPWSGKFSTKKIYGGFPQKRLFPDQVIFLEVKDFLWSEEFFYKGKSFDIFNTKSLHKRCFSSIIHFCSFLYFSCEVVHYRKKSIYIFQEIFTSTNKTFILRWRLSTRQ